MSSTSESAPHDDAFTSQGTGGGNEAPNGEPSVDAAEGEARTGQPFGGMSPQEAGRRSAEVRRQRREAAAEQAEREAEAAARGLDDRQSDLAIVARLRRDAAGGNTQAARELRAWLDAIRAGDDVEEWEALAPHRRDLFESWLLQEERQASGIAASPRAEQL